jgi:hypothetical protein
MVALFAALAGSAVSATIVPLAKRALTADHAKVADKAKTASTSLNASNAALLQGKTAEEIAALVQIPPVSSIAALVTVRHTHWSIPRQGITDAVAPCAAGEKAVGGGWDNPNGPTFGFDSKPTVDDTGWVVHIENPSNSIGAEGEVYVVCVR